MISTHESSRFTPARLQTDCNGGESAQMQIPHLGTMLLINENDFGFKHLQVETSVYNSGKTSPNDIGLKAAMDKVPKTSFR